MALEILFEDNHLLALNKPAGLLTQPTEQSADSLETQAKAYLKASRGKPGDVYLTAVHRLDRQVSGVVLFACTSKAASRLQGAIREREGVGKLYWALVEGTVLPNAGTLEHYLRHGDHQAELVSRDAPGAKLARLFYRVREQRREVALLEIELETGRYHQIRAQLAASGHPIVGDRRYGSRRDLPGDGIALHHRQLTIVHPVRREPLTFTADPPRW